MFIIHPAEYERKVLFMPYLASSLAFPAECN